MQLFFPPQKKVAMETETSNPHIKATDGYPTIRWDLKKKGEFVLPGFLAALKTGPNLPTLFNDPFKN